MARHHSAPPPQRRDDLQTRADRYEFVTAQLLRFADATARLVRGCFLRGVEICLWIGVGIVVVRAVWALSNGWTPDDLLRQVLPSLKFVAAPPGNPISPIATWTFTLWTLVVGGPKAKAAVQRRRAASTDKKGRSPR